MSALSNRQKFEVAVQRLREISPNVRTRRSSAPALFFDNLFANQPDLIPLSVVCDELKIVSRKTVHDWRSRPKNYPKGRAELTILAPSGIMFRKDLLVKWLNSNQRKRGVKKK
jgi:hypothetical protein